MNKRRAKMREEVLKIMKDTKRAYEYFLNELSYNITPNKLQKLTENHLDMFNLIDVRDYEDYIEGHIPYAVHIPHHSLEDNFDKFSKNKINIIYAHSLYCFLAKKVALRLTEKGYPAAELKGGFHIWKKLGLEIVKTSSDDTKTFEEK
jgi:rhodanese-related sulfurtransferase